MPNLVLYRRVGESIVLTAGDTEITVSFVSWQGKAIRVAIEAPRHVNIRRSEVPKLAEQKET